MVYRAKRAASDTASRGFLVVLNPPTIHVSSVGYSYDENRAGGVVQGKQNSVVAASCRSQSFEFSAQWFAHTLGIGGKGSGDELYDSGRYPRREPI